MKVGSLVYATEQGLGRLARSFYDAGVVTDVMIVAHGSHPTQAHWYPGAQEITDLKSLVWYSRISDFISKMDVMLFFETPFRWEFLGTCRELKKRSFLMTMFECTPAELPALPDVFLCPSLLDYEVFIKHDLRDGGVPSFKPTRGEHGKDCYFTPIPVDVPWRLREKAEVFVHNGGHGSFRDRNGTLSVLEAWRYVQSPAKLILRSQRGLPAALPMGACSGLIDYRLGTTPYDQLWHEGDVFIFPERFNGLSLPLQEARAAGMLVMAGNRFPMNTWLPQEPLIPMSHHVRAKIGSPYMEFDEAHYDPQRIAAMVDEWYGRDISDYSKSGKEWAESMSWERLRPEYIRVLGS